MPGKDKTNEENSKKRKKRRKKKKKPKNKKKRKKKPKKRKKSKKKKRKPKKKRKKKNRKKKRKKRSKKKKRNSGDSNIIKDNLKIVAIGSVLLIVIVGFLLFSPSSSNGNGENGVVVNNTSMNISVDYNGNEVLINDPGESERIIIKTSSGVIIDSIDNPQSDTVINVASIENGNNFSVYSVSNDTEEQINSFEKKPPNLSGSF